MSQQSKKPAPKAVAPSSSNVDAVAIKELATILKETELTEIEYETDACRIRVAKHGIPMAMPSMPMPVAPQGVMAEAPAPSAPAAPTTAVDDLSKHPGLLKAPMVGTVYLSAQPGAPTFVTEGKAVAEGDTLLIIEAMKVMNPIRAHKAGVVKKILVADAEPVEYDHGLMIIE